MAVGEGGELAGVEAALEDGHEEGGDLGVGDELVFGGAVDDGADEGWISASVRARPSRLWRMTSMGWMGWVMAVLFEEEGCGEEVGDGGLVEGAVLLGEEDDGVGGAEFEDGLAAGSAGLAGGVVEVGDGDGADADGGAVEGDGGGDGGLLGAGGEAVGGVFDVAAGDDGAVCEQEGGADAEVAVGRVGVLGGGDGALLEVCDLVWGEGVGWRGVADMM